MGKESNLLKKVGTKNPFNVPDQYFENFTRELMNQLPEKENIPTMPELTLWQRVKPWVYMAAMFAGIALMFKVFVWTSDDFTNSQLQAESKDADSEIVEDFIFYNNVSDYTIYEFIAEVD